jgi:hypothetical protein
MVPFMGNIYDGMQKTLGEYLSLSITAQGLAFLV